MLKFVKWFRDGKTKKTLKLLLTLFCAHVKSFDY